MCPRQLAGDFRRSPGLTEISGLQVPVTYPMSRQLMGGMTVHVTARQRYFAVVCKHTYNDHYIGGFHMSHHQKHNRKHSIDEFKNLAYDRILIYKQPCKDLDLCSFSYVSYLEKRFNQIYRALYGDAMLVSLGGTPIWRLYSDRNSCC